MKTLKLKLPPPPQLTSPGGLVESGGYMGKPEKSAAPSLTKVKRMVKGL